MSFELQQRACIRAVRAGCRVAAQAQQDWLGRSVRKDDASPVTVADFAVQAVITHHLLSNCSSSDELLLVAEETRYSFMRMTHEQQQECLARVQREVPEVRTVEHVANLIARGSFVPSPAMTKPCFVLDPIDGTKGFIRGEQYAVCLGRLDANGAPEMGVIGCPKLWSREEGGGVGYLFEAHVGLGAGTRIRRLFIDEHNKEEEEDVVLQTVTQPAASTSSSLRFTESYESSHSAADSTRVHNALLAALDCKAEDVVRVDSQVKYGLLVRGDCQVYARITSYHQCLWDVLPGAVILQQAGGTITDDKGQPLDYVIGGRAIPRKVLICTASPDASVHARAVQVFSS